MKKADFSIFRKYCSKPQRIVWAVARYEDKQSICPLGWKMNTSSSPIMMAISVAPSRFTHDLIVKSGEFVLAWPGEDLAGATILCGTSSGRNMDKFKEAKLTAISGQYVKAPLIKECIANLECRLTGQLTTGDHTIFAGEVLATWVNENPPVIYVQLICREAMIFSLKKKVIVLALLSGKVFISLKGV